ncbi:hypothetical protein ACJMK2_017298 [Sinanodonta woodiana]|uniref:Uncharacterized protein n=1 Tax=Sinanodonta woodiana TaxID=1069815 RepID=A0ABD3UXG0_SINWO
MHVSFPVEQVSPVTELRNTDEGNVITIMGITAGSLIGMIIIVVFVVWISKRSILQKSQQRVPDQAGNSNARRSEYQLDDLTNSPQETNDNGIGSVSSFEYLSYDGLYVRPFVQGIPTICSNCKYIEPPPSYNDNPMTPNESPPTYEEVLMDPSRFYLTIRI